MPDLYYPDGSIYTGSPLDRQAERLQILTPGNELGQIIREATQSVEDMLKLEDTGWYNLSSTSGSVITNAERITNLQLSRLYAVKDPLGKQSIRLWTDYTFGPGFTWSVPEDSEQSKKVLEEFWNSPANKPVLSARGQRKSSDKLLIDGDIFFALFLGGQTDEPVIRWVEPLEITEFITDPDDKENVKFYRRDWLDAQSTPHTDYYRSTMNQKGDMVKDASGKLITHTQEALIYHLSYNTTTQRGNPLLLPALDWIKQYRSFLSSRIAIMLSLAKFAWRSKVKGGQTAVSAIKAKTDAQNPAAGSILVENMGVDTTPIKTETGAKAAYDDARMIKLQVCAAVGIPEQYFGDISIGNLATAKTVELPMLKMFQSYQAVWSDTYQDIDEIVLKHKGVPPDKWYIDREFPPVAPEDVVAAAQAISQILTAIPDLGDTDAVKQIALITMGVNDPSEVLKTLSQEAKANPEIALAKALRQFKEVINGNGSK